VTSKSGHLRGVQPRYAFNNIQPKAVLYCRMAPSKTLTLWFKAIEVLCSGRPTGERIPVSVVARRTNLSPQIANAVACEIASLDNHLWRTGAVAAGSIGTGATSAARVRLR
jgi:hypothetical protein